MPELSRVTRTIRTAVRLLQHPHQHVECHHCGANLRTPNESCPNCDRGEPTTFELD